MSREAGAPLEAYENATGDPNADYAASACDDGDVYVSVTNRAIVESLSDVDDWFDAPPWRPRGAALADAVEKRIVDERRSYVVFPRFYDAAATQELRDELDRMFHGDACARNRAYDAGGAATWKAGTDVPYLFLARVFGTVEDEPKRLRITELMANAFRTVLAVSPQYLLPVVRLTTNKIAADYAGIELG